MTPTVLLCMVGLDYQRTLDGIKYWYSTRGIQKVYLFHDRKKDKYGFTSQKNAEALASDLKLFEAEQVGYNPQSYEDTFISLYKALRFEVEKQKRSVLVDSTGTTKIAYGAVVTIAMMFDKVGVYIVPAKEYGWYVPEPGSTECTVCSGLGRLEFNEWFGRVRAIQGMKPQTIHLPGSRLEKPSIDEEVILRRLDEHRGRTDSIRSLIGWCGENPYDSATKNRFSRLVKRLALAGLIEEEEVSKVKPVRLTGFGEVLARALRAYRAEEEKTLLTV